jgi:rhodanese-related sulfurtransferase
VSARAGTSIEKSRAWRAWLAAGLVILVAAAAGAGNVTEISADELLARAGKPGAPLILDVRSAEEFASGRVSGAKHVPYDEVSARLGELGPPREVVVYCEKGGRATKAAEALGAAGFTVKHLTGDMKAWREAGRAMEK